MLEKGRALPARVRVMMATCADRPCRRISLCCWLFQGVVHAVTAIEGALPHL